MAWRIAPAPRSDRCSTGQFASWRGGTSVSPPCGWSGNCCTLRPSGYARSGGYWREENPWRDRLSSRPGFPLAPSARKREVWWSCRRELPRAPWRARGNLRSRYAPAVRSPRRCSYNADSYKSSAKCSGGMSCRPRCLHIRERLNSEELRQARIVPEPPRETLLTKVIPR